MSNRKVICVGRAPLPGCRTTLTVIERRSFKTHCEYCETAFQDRWRAWSLGDHDPDFDDLFGAQKPKKNSLRSNGDQRASSGT